MNEQKESYEYWFEELERAMPIHLGGLKLLFTIFVITGAIIGVVFSVIVAESTKNEGLLFLAHGLTLGGTSAVSIFALWTLYSFQRLHPTWPASWLRRYWQNNVIGRDACIHLHEDGEYCVQIVNRGKKFATYDCHITHKEDRFMIRLNLGGWQNRTLNLFLDTRMNLTDLEYWQVKLKRFDRYRASITITVRDPNDNRLTLEAKHLLNALAHFHSKRGGLAGDNITLLRHLLEYSEHKYGQWQEEQTRANELDVKLESAIDTIFSSSQALKDTSRVGKSTEGKVIRKEMETGLLGLLSEDDPRRSIIKPQTQAT